MQNRTHLALVIALAVVTLSACERSDKPAVVADEPLSTVKALGGEGNWAAWGDKSAVTDKRSVTVMTESKASIFGAGYMKVRPEFAFHCDGEKFYATWDWKSVLDEDSPVMVTRLDQGKPARGTYRISRDHTSFGLIDSHRARTLLSELLKANTYGAQTHDYEGRELEVQFDVSGLEKYIGDLGAACPLKVGATSAS